MEIFDVFDVRVREEDAPPGPAAGRRDALRRARDRGAAASRAGRRAARRYGNGFLTNAIGNPVETTIVVSHLIFEGTAVDHVFGAPGLSDADRVAILGANLVSLLSIP
jgi:hypothetical protein